MQLKPKFLRGAFRQSWSFNVTRFSMHLGPSFDTMLLSSPLSQLHTLCVAQPLLKPQIHFLKCSQLNLQTFACFCTIDHTQILQGLLIPHNGFHKLS